MAHLYDVREALGSTPQRRLRTRNLKACPVCGGLNAKQNRECFICRWSGRFDEDAESIERGLNDLIDRCPEIAEILFEPRPARPGFLTKVRHWMGRFRRRLDLQV